MKYEQFVLLLAILLPLSTLADYDLECGDHFDLSQLKEGESVNIYSHTPFQKKYPTAPYKCKYSLKRGSQCKAWSLTCSEFATKGKVKRSKGTTTSRGDCMTVQTLTPPNDFKQKKYCGKSGPHVGSKNDTSILVKFKATKRVSSKGFNCSFTCRESSIYYKGPPLEPEDTCFCGLPNRKQRIIGGTETEVNEYPWHVKVGHRCSGTLVTNRHVITVAHCVDWVSSTSVRLGVHDSNADAYVFRNTKKITKHEYFGEHVISFNFNMAVLTLEDPPIDFKAHPNIRPACLPTRPTYDKVGELCVVTGWGWIDSSGKTSTTLREGVEKIYSFEECTDKEGMNYKYRPEHVTESMVCTAFPGQRACYGDAGGPLACSKPDVPYDVYELTGIISWGKDCRNYPTVHTKVYEYLESFFMPILKDGSFCENPKDY